MSRSPRRLNTVSRSRLRSASSTNAVNTRLGMRIVRPAKRLLGNLLGDRPGVLQEPLRTHGQPRFLGASVFAGSEGPDCNSSSRAQSLASFFCRSAQRKCSLRCTFLCFAIWAVSRVVETCPQQLQLLGRQRSNLVPSALPIRLAPRKQRLDLLHSCEHLLRGWGCLCFGFSRPRSPPLAQRQAPAKSQQSSASRTFRTWPFSLSAEGACRGH